MNSFHRFIALLVLAVWLPMTSHCYLEEAGIWEIAVDECCSDETPKPGKADSCDSGCKIVEKAGFKFQDDQKLIVPALVTLLAAPLSAPEKISPSLSEVVSWPPDTLHLVQFVACTALPPRAPSFVS